MTTQKAIEAITDFREVAYGHAVLAEALDMAIEALQQGCEKVAESCDDLISRSKAIRWVKAECNPYGQPTLDYESGIKVIEHLERMSSAQVDLSGFCDRLWKSAYDRGYERCKDDAVDEIKNLVTSMSVCISLDECKGMKSMQERAINVLESLPSEQAEIIRCENCRRRDDKWEDWEEGKVLYWCDIMDGCVKADDFCSYAERKDNG